MDIASSITVRIFSIRDCADGTGVGIGWPSRPYIEVRVGLSQRIELPFSVDMWRRGGPFRASSRLGPRRIGVSEGDIALECQCGPAFGSQTPMRRHQDLMPELFKSAPGRCGAQGEPLHLMLVLHQVWITPMKVMKTRQL